MGKLDTNDEARGVPRRKLSLEEKFRIVLRGMCGEMPISELCRSKGISTSNYYRWSKAFLEAGKHALTGDILKDASSGEVRRLKKESASLRKALKLNRQRLLYFLSELPTVAFIVAPDYSIYFANPAFRRLFGEPEGRRCHELIWGRDKPCTECRAFMVLENKIAVEWRWTSHDGRTYQLYNYPFTDVDGSPLAMELGVDITSVGGVEEKLSGAKDVREKIVNSISDPLVVIDPKTFQIVDTNNSFLRRGGRASSREVLGQPCYKVLYGRKASCESAGIKCPVLETVRTGERVQEDRTYLSAEGREKVVEITTHPVLDRKNDVELVVLFERDVTCRRKEIEQDLNSKIDELEKKQFKLSALPEIYREVNRGATLPELLTFIEGVSERILPDSIPLLILPDAQRGDIFMGEYCTPRGLRHLRRIRELLDKTGLMADFLSYLENCKSADHLSSLNRGEGPAFQEVLSEMYPSWFGFPVQSREHCVGFFLLGAKEFRDFGDDDVKFFIAIFGQLAAQVRHFVLHDTHSRGHQSKGSSRGSYGDIVGRSEEMQKVYRLIETVSGYDATVLIAGENGTGKEMVAKAIHENSNYKKGPFVVAHCSAYSPTLLESEIFGHEKGAFTGAIRQKKGRLERASGGTLFLDEIGDISTATQVLLLRFLQDRSFERVGGEKTIHTDVRVLAATNRDLYQEVNAGKFREDLYYRLNVFSIQLPPLKNRIEDIPLLSEHFLKKCCQAWGRNHLRFSPRAMSALKAYDWPGNVRQLENAISHAVILAKGDVVRKNHLPRYIWEAPSPTSETSISANERRLILKVLKETDWNIREAAQRLNVCRTTVYNKIRRYNLKKDYV